MAFLHTSNELDVDQRNQFGSGIEDLLQDARAGMRKLSSRLHSVNKSKSSEEGAVRRGMIRFMVVIIDCSENMNQRDIRPTRLEVARQTISSFVSDFFDQNPISQISLIEIRDGKAESISELSGNSLRHQKLLDARIISEYRGLGKGSPSIRSALESALRLLELQASYGTREILMLYGSLSTCDRDDIFDTINRLKASGVRVNIVGLAAEMFIARTICKETGGIYEVATHNDELRRFVLRHTIPPPTPAELCDMPASGMWAGFPARVDEPVAGWQCPRCHSVYSHIPVDCGLCGLKLMSASHLARSYHHLFPVPAFSPAPAPPTAACAGCGISLAGDGGEGQEAAGRECGGCGGHFCEECDAFVHEALHVCPGCEARPA